MLTMKYPANFLSTLQLSPTSIFDRAGTNDATTQLEAIETNLRTAQQRYRERRYQDAIDAYKTAQSLIYRLIQPSHALSNHVLDDSVMLPIGKNFETAVASASLKLAEAIQPVMQAPLAPVSTTDVQLPANLLTMASIGFSQDDSVPQDVSDRAAVGLEHLAHGRVTQAIEVLSAALDSVSQPPTVGQNANAGAVALDLSAAKLAAGQVADAQAMAERAAAFFTAAGDTAGQSQALHNQGIAAVRLQQTDKANASFQQASSLFQSVATSWNVNVATRPPATGGVAQPPIGGVAQPATGGVAQPPIAGGITDAVVVGTTGVQPIAVSTPISPVIVTSTAAALGGLIRRTTLATAPRAAMLETAIIASPGVAATLPQLSPAAEASVALADLNFVAQKDASIAAIRWPGTGGGWGQIKLPNPAEAERQQRTWSLKVPAGGEIQTLVWQNGARPSAQALLESVYDKRIITERPGDLVVRPRGPADMTAHLTHVYAFVIPQGLGDCYHQIGNFQRAEEYYFQAADYSYINAALEGTALWIRLATNALQWGDHLYRQEQIEAAKAVYANVVTAEGKAAAGTPLYDRTAFASAVTDAGKVFASLDDPLSVAVNPGIASPIVTIWARWQNLLAGLDYYGTTFTPIFTFEYLQQVALGFAQQSVQAEQQYVNFQVHAESEAATRRDLQGAMALSGAETAGRREQLKGAQADTAGMNAAVKLAELRAELAERDRDRYAELGYDQIKFQSVAAAHGAGADWHGDEIRRLARDMEAGSWHGERGKLAAAATLLAGERSYEYQLGRLDSDVESMRATIPVATAQRDAAVFRERAAALALAAAQLRENLTSDALAAFENEVFTPELWSRMADAMRELSRSFQEWAITSARLAERAYNFETDNALAVIKGEYPGSATGGLLGSEYLLRDIESFTYHFVAHQRSKETNVKDVISLATEYPLQFAELCQTGAMDFETSLRDFDVRHPGLFGQRIQSVEVEVIGLLPPEGVRGTLRGGGVSRYRTADGGERLRVHTMDTMALSDFTAREDGLLYRQDPRMHGLFEGHGVATTWQLALPRRSNNLDYRLITDVRLVLYYNARYDAALEARVHATPALPGEMIHVRDLQPRYDFPEAWYPFLDSGVLTFELTPPYLPRNETNFRADKVSLRLRLAGDLSPEGISTTLTLPGQPPVTQTTDANGQLTTSPGNDLAAVMGGPLLGRWELRIEPPAGSPLLGPDGKLNPDVVEHVDIVAQYAFDWPE